MGILEEFRALGEIPFGFEAAIVSDVPLGAGLSSSASLEVAFALGLKHLYGFELDGLELVKLCQRAENNFVGVPCGIMDQYVSYFAQSSSAIFLDTLTLKYQLVPVNLKEVAFLIVDSGVRRSLSYTGYAQRRQECEEAVKWFSKKLKKADLSLRDLDLISLERVKDEMPKLLYYRAKHVVEENLRVLDMIRALEVSDASAVGKLLTNSHVSLRDLFDVSIPELDFLVETGLQLGALGARLIGGGFGGSTLHLIPLQIKERYVKSLSETYYQKFGLQINMFEVKPAGGAEASFLD
ncbi:galactokinase [Candidatus Bipolaricaulota bacterium]|nr:galactokinase [Candidatus Bipolaricaulota bacterium]